MIFQTYVTPTSHQGGSSIVDLVAIRCTKKYLYLRCAHYQQRRYAHRLREKPGKYNLVNFTRFNLLKYNNIHDVLR